jgi:hypothetical protein
MPYLFYLLLKEQLNQWNRVRREALKRDVCGTLESIRSKSLFLREELLSFL